VTEQSKEQGERAGKTALDHEAASRATREKMARLRELRLAQEASKPAVAKPSGARVAGSRIGGKKKPTKAAAAAEKTVPLSDWLATQQREGRRG
jgi:hypothetical protein